MLMTLLLVRTSAEVRTDAGNYEKLCAYDEWCRELKTDSGEFVPPDPNVVAVVRSLNQPLVQIARTLGVDSAAVAGAIIAGNSLGPQIDGDTGGFLETLKGTSFVNQLSRVFRGKSFSLGLAQIKPETAGDAEPLLAKIENRRPRSLGEITAALADPVESVKYATAIIRQCQDAYQKRGFDVSGDPALLATMYNVGGCPRRAAEAARSGRGPRLNFFGFFVRHYHEEIVAGVGLDDVAMPSLVAATGIKTLARRLREGVRLAPHPPNCEASAVRETPSPIANGEFKILAPGVDCDLKEWSLIQTSGGAIGWVMTDVLDQKSESFVRGPSAACNPRPRDTCLARLKAIFKEASVDTDGLLEVPRATPEQLGRLTNDVCAENLFVGDAARVDRPSAKFHYKPMIAPDRLAIQIWDGCARPNAVEATLDPERTGATK